MPTEDKRSFKLSIYLLKEEVRNFRSALKEDVLIKGTYNIKEEIGVDGQIYIGETKETPSTWQELLQEGVNETLPELLNSSNRAIVFFLIDSRVFAIVFGYGKHLIKDDAIDRDFGLRTVLNIVNPSKLLSIDKANLDELTVLTRTQTSIKSKQDMFNIDVIKDLLKGITGEPLERFSIRFGKVITGSEGINIIPKVRFDEIPQSLRELKEAYDGKEYKTHFEWIDNLKNERDPEVVKHLCNRLIESLAKEDIEAISLSPPFLVDWDRYAGFSFTPEGEVLTDFRIESFYEHKKSNLEDLTWEKLQSYKIFFKLGDEEMVPIPLWRCLNYQTDYDNHVYVFALSKWYKVNKSFSAEIKDYVARIKESDLDFIDCKRGYKEGEYNVQLADSQPYYRLLDKKLVKSDFTRSEIEVCDVISESGEFIHVKFRHSSATLSHLFAQGKISAYSLRRDRTFRENFKRRLRSEKLTFNHGAFETARLDPSKYTITFAIIDEKPRSFVDSLPFFSLLNFRLTADDLFAIGYDVRVKKIGVSD